MPYSTDTFAENIRTLIANTGYARFLDVGAGAGKYGKMIREIIPEAHITAIEPYNPYIDRFKLKEIYDEVLNIKAVDLIGEPDFETDLVIMGDVIEHMKRSEAIDFLDFISYRAKKILIAFPVAYAQDEIEGNKLEAHISLWQENDLNRYSVEEIIKDGHEILILLNGIKWEDK